MVFLVGDFPPISSISNIRAGGVTSRSISGATPSSQSLTSRRRISTPDLRCAKRLGDVRYTDLRSQKETYWTVRNPRHSQLGKSSKNTA